MRSTLNVVVEEQVATLTITNEYDEVDGVTPEPRTKVSYLQQHQLDALTEWVEGLTASTLIVPEGTYELDGQSDAPGAGR